jgi:hypothetical protein
MVEITDKVMRKAGIGAETADAEPQPEAADAEA